jgi:tetratricopeptide (TPR) repeat protein
MRDPSGDTVMLTARIRPRHGIALVAMLALLGLAYTARAADDEEALKAQALSFNDITGDDPIEGEIKVLVKDPEGSKKLLAVAAGMAKNKKKQPFNYNAAYILARTAQDLKQVDVAIQFFRICKDDAVKLQSGSKLIQSFGGLIDLLYDNKKFDQVVAECDEFIKMEGDDQVTRLKFAVMERMIQAYARQGKTDEALKRVEDLVRAEAKTEGWYFHKLKAWVLREAGKLDESAKLYETVLDRIANDKGLDKKERMAYADQVRYILSSIFVDLKQIDKAAEQLQGLLKDHPNNPTYNNDLGYIWADNDKNLDEAEKLVRKALEEDRKERKNDPDYDPKLDRDNAAYLDSLGWVLYKQKKYKEAKKYLQEAVKEKEGQHIEIFDHLGDVLLALKQKDQAIEAWQKGLDSVGTSKREQERKAVVEKKLKDLQ